MYVLFFPEWKLVAKGLTVIYGRKLDGFLVRVGATAQSLLSRPKTKKADLREGLPPALHEFLRLG
jgi:hypothetical protein